MTQISLRKLTEEEAINLEKYFPEIKTIWANPVAFQEAIFYTRDWAIDKESTGEIFFINLDDRKIGITGFFLKKKSTNTAGLRWHGIIPSLRRNGYSQQALSLLAKHIQKVEPSRKYLAEAVPVHRLDLLDYFGKIGFKKWNDQEKGVDYTEVINIRAEVKKLAR